MRSCASGSSPRIAGPDDAVDDLRDHVLFGDAGEAVADQAVVGLDLDMQHASDVLRSTPTSLMCSGTLSGVAVTRAIFMMRMTGASRLR